MIPMLSTLLLCVVLVGCGNQGAGVSTESQSSKGTSQGSQLDRTKTLTTEKRTTAMITIPVVPLIGEAWKEVVQAKASTNNPCIELWGRIWPRMLAGERIDGKDEPSAIDCAFGLAYSYAFLPVLGWPMQPESEGGSAYIAASLAHVLVANNVASEIAAQVSVKAYQDPEEAKATIKELLAARRDYFLQVYPLVYDLARTEGLIDTSGKAEGVAFTTGAYYLNLTKGGAMVKYSGVDWFGNGNLSGKRYEMQLASITSVAMTKAKAVTQGSEQKAGTSDKAQAGVK